MQKKFKAKAEPAGPQEAWCCLAIPFDVPEVWGTRGRVRVKGTINGFPFRTNIQPMDGRHLLTFNKQLQAGANARPGDLVEVTMERDLEEPRVETPVVLAKAFRQNKEARSLWQKLAYTHRKEFAQWISARSRSRPASAAPPRQLI